MITVNCKDVLPIQHQILVYVADSVGAIPAIKHDEFILSSIENDEKIDSMEVRKSIQEYLDSIGEGSNFTVIPDSVKLYIKSINGKKINKITPPVKTVKTCCGF